jgi:hypothetical protein
MRAFLLKLFSLVVFGVFFAKKSMYSHGEEDKNVLSQYKGKIVMKNKEWMLLVSIFEQMLDEYEEGREVKAEFQRQIPLIKREILSLFFHVMEFNLQKEISVSEKIDSFHVIKKINTCITMIYCIEYALFGNACIAIGYHIPKHKEKNIGVLRYVFIANLSSRAPLGKFIRQAFLNRLY